MDALAKSLGITAFTSIQTQAISSIVRAANDAELCPHHLIHLPTGAGKTLIFMGVARLLGKSFLVVYPLLALLEDQFRRCGEAGIPAMMLRGAMDPWERARTLHALAGGDVKLILCTPEILGVSEIQRVLQLARIQHCVVDEAHVVAQWGATFRPAYQSLGLVLAKLGIRHISGFSATMGPRIQKTLRQLLLLDQEYILVEDSMDRPGIRYQVLHCPSPEWSLAHILSGTPSRRPALVFCGTRKMSELAARAFRRRAPGISSRFFHAGLDPQEKSAICAWYHNSNDGVLFATCAYGMGLDKKNIRTVIHLILPESIEEFLQESGRAGRDGRPSLALTLCGPLMTPKGSMAAWTGLNSCRREFLLEGLLGKAKTDSKIGIPTGGCCDLCQHPRPIDYHPRGTAFLAKVQRAPWIWKRDEWELKLSTYGEFAAWTRRERFQWIDWLIARRILKKSSFPLWFGTLGLSHAVLDNPYP